MGRVYFRRTDRARVATVVERIARAAAESVDLGIAISGRAFTPRVYHADFADEHGVIALSALDETGPGPRLARAGVVSDGVVIGLDDPCRAPCVFDRLLRTGRARIHLVPAPCVRELIEARNLRDLRIRSGDEPRSVEYGAAQRPPNERSRFFVDDDDDPESLSEGDHFGSDCPDPLRRLVTD